MIDVALLELTNGAAPGIMTYGGPGLTKTLAAATLPAPVLDLDWDGGAGSLLPWTRRRRKWDDPRWITISTDARQRALDLVDPLLRRVFPIKKPYPMIDVILFDPSQPAAYDELVKVLALFNPREYNTLMLDAVHELSFGMQTYTKRQSVKNWDVLDIEAKTRVLDTPMKGDFWGGVQERTSIQFKRIKNFRNQGVIVYFTGGEAVDKDYVTDPRNQEKGQKEDPYAQKGSIWAPGKMVATAVHGVDILMRAKPSKKAVEYEEGGQKRVESVSTATWSTVPEPFPGGSGVYWDAKDRYGRLPDQVTPNFQSILSYIYGKEGAAAIYAAASAAKVEGSAA